ncbi:pyrimidine-nucleoside phosphorylase [Melissococcus plutonius]|uniref:Pyrimidine-nucleoside phosphorylase n=1 Tax=Melissococcus plutonius (strain ATCC 35311 / DSM 29964 / CIP 104052 / LMG 20360 / NCIMB 702443) TaxID=940190 RepID=F3YCJ8_MELPT|nr:pyrimidine-nucleoside phosphorylase [Melissococcus plutonius]AIM26008.1 pyrimidine-nucleoside phosphorylase Pdp [Melissococcus plutonius S1]KMT23728.1 pyrimidine-nucleoside phosphorylase Pdp [Melissococcus plutonius]KMT24312.1 pyrimidine-nucleoside phosphorylase Pdp [Melissococcus plutonius]KMT26996.1 pyrimidine-nucleoside phosphorylase Pdp [Melissococcus plutonius]KMT28359.1 pyrimidine-nucleoside phosphorylase Pdp [Melissococcus plutonius]
MRMVDVIDKKRNGNELTEEEIQFFIEGVTTENIPDYQITALLMAIYFQGMTTHERKNLTIKMLESGDRLDLSTIPGIKVDKHSTGGVGDKVSLPLAAMVSAIGIPVPMVSGRGLGHTGGTLDKLEAIPGYQVEMSQEDFIKQVKNEKLAIIGATGNIAPADKKIYALRDVTDTVDSIPLIASSIMSKKIASGTDALVIDVKTGTGAFMKTLDKSIELAKALVEIGKSVGMNCLAVISDMNQPLGNKIGNSLEIEESIDLLKNKGPQDLRELTLTLGSYMVILGGKAQTYEEARILLEDTLSSGTALDCFRAMIKAQGGNSAVIDDYTIMPQATYKIDLPAEKSGYVTQIIADKIGIASMLLGGGRQKAVDQLDYAVGLELHKKIGDPVEQGESLMTIYSNREHIEEIKQLLYDNIIIGDKIEKPKMIYQIIE